MRLRRKLIILLVVAALIAEISLALATTSDESESSEPAEIEVIDYDVCVSPTDEPLPCTNQRYKAWFGGS